MTRFAILIGALAIPAALAAQQPTPRDTTPRRSSEPVFLSADSVAKLRSAADSQAKATTAAKVDSSARRADTSLARTVTPAPVTPAAQPAEVSAAQPEPAEARDSIATELSYTPPVQPSQPGSVWLTSTTTRRGTLSRGMTRGPDGRIFLRPEPDGGVWMVAISDSASPEQAQTAPVSGVVREESAGEVAPALSTSVRTNWADMSRADIRELQGAMADAGCAVGAIDGLVGPRTRGALECVKQKYQITNPQLTPVLEALNLRLTSDMP